MQCNHDMSRYMHPTISLVRQGHGPFPYHDSRYHETNKLWVIRVLEPGTISVVVAIE